MRHRASRSAPKLAAALVALFLGVGSATAAVARTPVASPATCSPCVYRVSPTGTGTHDLAYAVQHVQAHDTVLLADGVYRVANLQVSAPYVKIAAEHVAAAGASPHVWLDGSLP